MQTFNFDGFEIFLCVSGSRDQILSEVCRRNAMQQHQKQQQQKSRHVRAIWDEGSAEVLAGCPGQRTCPLCTSVYVCGLLLPDYWCLKFCIVHLTMCAPSVGHPTRTHTHTHTPTRTPHTHTHTLTHTHTHTFTHTHTHTATHTHTHTYNFKFVSPLPTHTHTQTHTHTHTDTHTHTHKLHDDDDDDTYTGRKRV